MSARTVLTLVLSFVLASCASQAVPGAASGTTAPAVAPRVSAAVASAASVPVAASAAASAAPAPVSIDVSRLPLFDKVVEGARRIEGPLVLWQKDDKLWIELRPQDLGVPLFFSPKLASGIGEAGFYGGLMRQPGIGGPRLVSFRRVSPALVQLIVPNTTFIAAKGTPAERAVQAAYSDSLMGSFAVGSQPKDGAVLLDAQGFFLSDLASLGAQLQATYRQGYSMDARNSSVISVRGSPTQTSLMVRAHLVAPGLSDASSAPGSTSAVPRTLPDPRSLFAQVHYSFTRLPDTPMPARTADARLGHFTTTVQDFSDEFTLSPKRRYVNRWRLEKKDPAAPMSEPVRPITFWLDRTLPEGYRPTVTAAILEWNKAFERIGFSNAIVVKTQGEKDDFDTLDTEHASVRWMTNVGTSFGAVAPSHVDPRSGEILDADIAIESLSTRSVRHLRTDILPHVGKASMAGTGQEPGAWAAAVHAHDESCQHASLAAEGLAYALELRAQDPAFDPEGPHTREFVLAYLKHTVMHETGHALGLRHNFRASSVYPLARLSDPAYGRSHALSGSLMDYDAINLAAPGQPEVEPFNTTLGAYDHWAIEYAYRPFVPTEEAAALAQLAARSSEPELAFATDEDSWQGVDPQVQTGDLGDDPVAFAKRRLAIAQDLLRRQEARAMSAQDEPARLRRSVSFALRDAGQATLVATRHVGGLLTLRDRGASRDPLQPVPVARQREALDVATTLLRGDGLAVTPALQRRLAPDYFERADAMRVGQAVSTDFSPAQVLLITQQAVLNQLYSDAVATRLLDNRAKLDAAKDTLSLRELQRAIEAAVWDGVAASESRRELQRSHLNLLANVLVRPAAYARGQARAELRVAARSLLARLERELPVATPDSAQQAHLADAVSTLKVALQAPLLRVTP